MHSDRNESRSRGPCATSPGFAPRPNGAPGDVCGRAGPSSLRRSDGWEGCIPETRRPRGRSGCRNPCPNTDAASCEASAWASGRRSPPGFASTASRHARWRRRSPRPRGRHRLRRPSCVSPRFCLDPSGFCPLDPPQTRLGQGAVGGLPWPVYSPEFAARPRQLSPDFQEDAVADPSRKVAMRRPVGAQLFGQLVPLATAAHSVEDAVERPPPVAGRSVCAACRPR